MIMQPDSEDLPVIVNVSIGDGVVNITFLQPREMSDAVGIQRTMQIDTDHVEEEMKELMENALALLDAGAVLLRNPPAKIPGRQALRELDDMLDD